MHHQICFAILWYKYNVKIFLISLDSSERSVLFIGEWVVWVRVDLGKIHQGTAQDW